MKNTNPVANEQFRDVYTISRLNREVRTVLEGGFPLLWLEGELSNFAKPASGHWYFTLKDQASQVRAAMFRSRNQNLTFTAKNGTKVLVRARVGLYEARGEFQCIVEHMEEAGDGALRCAFDELKQRLDQQGLFSPALKRPIPVLSQCIGIISSATGAAVHDILTTLKRRYPSIPVIIYPVTVQGKQAAPEIVNAFKLAQQRKECDTLILARGGGSLEDLWAFNEEIVVRAIADCTIPVVTGIGHEIDFTIADFVADLRAATPTAAAEACSPDQQGLRNAVSALQQKLTQTMLRIINENAQRLKWYRNHLKHPGRYLQEVTQRIDELSSRFIKSWQQQHVITSTRLQNLQQRLLISGPSTRLQRQKDQQQHLQQRLFNAWQKKFTQQQQQLKLIVRTLDTVSPLATLQRGYAIVKTIHNNQILRSTKDISIGENVSVTLNKGEIICHVEKINNN